MDGMTVNGAALPAAGNEATLRDAVAAAALLDDLAWMAARGAEAKRLRVRAADLDKLRRAAIKASRTAPEPEPEPPEPEEAAEEAAPESLAHTLARLVELPALEREGAIKEAVRRHQGMTVKAMRDAVRAELRKRDAAARAAHTAGGAPGPGETIWPWGYSMTPEGLFCDGGEDAPPLRLCPPFEVRGLARDKLGERHSLLLRWHDCDGRAHDWPMPLALTMDMSGELARTLAGKGLVPNPDPTALLRLRCALAEVRHGDRARLVDRAGWHGTAYAFGDGAVVGDTGEPMIFAQASEAAAQAVATAGTLAGWQDGVAARVQGNPLPMFCLAAAFAGPLLASAGEDGAGIHLFGKSKAGKTAAAKAAVSAWGPPDKTGGLRDWRATANGLEAACADAADGLLTLDEIHQAEAREVAAAIYAMGNGGGKARMTKNLTARARATWRTFILSTGEPPVDAVVAAGGKRLPEGAAVRLPSMPAEGDCWPELHGAATRAAFMVELHRAMQDNHGHAARAFVERLAQDRRDDAEGVEGVVRECRDALRATLPDGADGQVQHVARMFALVAAGGELAISYGVLPWPAGAALQAAAAALRAWVARRGGVGAGEDSDALHRLRAFIAANPARFEVLGDDGGEDAGRSMAPGFPANTGEPRILNRAGWKQREADGRWCYLLTPEAWRAEVFAGADPKAGALALAKAGILARGDGNNLTRSTRIPGEGKVRLYHVMPGLLEREAAPS